MVLSIDLHGSKVTFLYKNYESTYKKYSQQLRVNVKQDDSKVKFV